MANLPDIKIGFVDYFDGIPQFFINWLSKKYNVIRDDENPDFLFFCDETFGTKNREFDNKPVIKIFYTGENRRPWDYKAHFALTFDNLDTDNHYRLPLYVIDYWMMYKKQGMSPLWAQMSDRKPDDVGFKTGFCCFISGNPGNPKRNRFFEKLNEYKRVDSYGPLFNNVGFRLPRGEDAAKNKNTILPKYKFNLCFENGDYPGYCTEKLFHALYMQTVPIYSGSSTAGVDFNPLAYMNWHDYLDDDKLFEMVVRMDNDDEMYKKMYLQPMFLKDFGVTQRVWQDYEYNKFFSQDRFLHWFDKNVYLARKR